MQSLKTLLGEARYNRCFQYHKEEDFVNHGLGFMLIAEHKHLIEISAIKCDGENDVIANDGCCVIASDDKGNRDCIFEGSYRDCKFELDRQKTNFKSKKLSITHYPKAYFDYYAKKNPIAAYKQEDQEALEALVQDFGGELLPAF